MAKRKVKLVYIKWDDASAADEIEEIDSKECIQETVGFLAKSDRYNYYLAMNYNHLNKACDERFMRIPKKYKLEFVDLTKFI